MKAEYTLFCGYAAELTGNILSPEDYKRVCQSIESKTVGFIKDMDDLASDIRLALSTGTFVLSEHTHKVFTLARRSALPRFLKGSLSRIFESKTGSLKEDYCKETCASLLVFLSSLKRTTPEGDTSHLEDQVWLNLRQNFGDGPRVQDEFEHALKTNPEFAQIALGAQERFQEYLNRVKVDSILSYGPGKNLDRFEACSSSNWYCDVDESHFYGDPELLKLFLELKSQANHAPFQQFWDDKKKKPKKAYGLRGLKDRSLKRFDFTMSCSSQPKSYKAFRGVGVMAAMRMAMQIALQRSFYRDALDEHIPLSDQSKMADNLTSNFEEIGTVDLSSASDRMYWSILDWMGGNSKFYRMCRKLRTRVLRLPDGLIECASPVMGEAITFPLLSTFFASIALSVCDYYGWGHDMVRVYGDDIQTPHYFHTIQVLELFGSKPSVQKSYPPESRFKESCEAHYLGSFDASEKLQYCRPTYIPDGIELNDRGRIKHSMAAVLLSLAHDAYKTSQSFSKAFCDFVCEHTKISYLPQVYAGTPYLGRPSSKTEDYRTLEIQYSPTSMGMGMTEHGIIRQRLRSPITSTNIDPILEKKQQRKLMASSVRRIQMRDRLKDLETQLYHVCMQRWHLEELSKAPKGGRDELFSYYQSHITADEFSTVVEEVISKLTQV